MPLVLENELLQAVTENNVDCVAKLLATGADPNAGIFQDQTALLIAVRNGNEAILDLLLQSGSLCCMREELVDTPKRSFVRWRLWRNVSLRVVIIFLATYVERAAAGSVALGITYRLYKYAIHYSWFLQYYTSASFASTSTMQSQYSNPWTFFGTLISMGLAHRLASWLVQYLMPTSSPYFSPPSYFQDLSVAIPLRFGIDLMVTIGRNLLRKVGLISLDLPSPKGDLASLPNPTTWRSPAEQVFESLLVSNFASEAMVLKLLRAKMLAAQPYEKSEVARKLLGLAVDNCWPEMTKFLVAAGAPVDQGVSSTANKLKWPALSEASAYVFSSKILGYLHASRFDGRSVLSDRDRFHLEYPEQTSTFLQLVQSAKFQRLATESSQDDQHDVASCQTMMKTLQDCGANPSSLDSSGRDALSYLAKSKCSTDLISFMAFTWKEAKARQKDVDEYIKIESPALYEAINSTIPAMNVVRILLDAGISPEWENRNGRTPLFAAAYMNTTTEALELLFRSGADPGNGGSKSYSPILRTLDDASYEKFICFLDHGVDVNGIQHNGDSLLLTVLERLGRPLIVLKARLIQSLLERGARVYDTMTQSAPSFLAAAGLANSIGWSETILNRLLQQIGPDHQQRQLDAALLIASKESILRPRSGDVFTIFYLLRNGADPTSVKIGLDSLLHLVCVISPLADHTYRDDMRTLLQRQVLDVNARGEKGQTPLHDAVKRHNRDFVLLLLEHEADPNIPDLNGQTPLQTLCSHEPEKVTIAFDSGEINRNGNDARYSGIRGQAAWGFEFLERKMQIKGSLVQEEIFQALVDHGGDTECMDDRGHTLLMITCERGNSVIAANILYIFGEVRFAEAINAIDFTGKTTLHHAAASGNLNTLKVLTDPHQILDAARKSWRRLAVLWEDDLVEKESKETESASERMMAEEEAAYKESETRAPSFLRNGCIRFERREEIKLTIGSPRRRELENIMLPNVSASKWTIDKSSGSIFQPDKLLDVKSRTPLHYAAENGHLEAVTFILEYITAIDVHAKDSDGQRAADLALENNFYDVYSVLEEAKS